METSEYVDILAAETRLGSLEKEAVAEFVELCEPRKMVTGEALWTVGEKGKSAYILFSGAVEIAWRIRPDGQQKRQVSSPGAFVALPHLIYPWKHESSAYPLEATRLLRIDRSEFVNLFDAQHPAAYRVVDAIAEELVDEVRDANRRMHEVFGHPAETLRMLRKRAHDSERH